MKKVSELIEMVKASKQNRDLEMWSELGAVFDSNMEQLSKEIEDAAARGELMCVFAIDNVNEFTKREWMATKIMEAVMSYDRDYVCSSSYDALRHAYVVVVKWGEFINERI